MKFNFAVVIPMANEEADFHPFVASLIEVLNMLECGKVYFIVDKVSKDNTLELCNSLSKTDDRFVTVWSPENKNVVDAYIKGYKKRLKTSTKSLSKWMPGYRTTQKPYQCF